MLCVCAHVWRELRDLNEMALKVVVAKATVR